MATTFKTLDDIINEVNRYDYNKIIFLTQTDDEDLIIRDTDLFTTYMRFIDPYVATYKVTPAQRNYYRYKPYLLSQDLYGTPALGWMLLMLNDRQSASKFRIKSTIRLIPKTYLNQLYDTVVTKSNSKLEKNWNTYLPLIEN